MTLGELFPAHVAEIAALMDCSTRVANARVQLWARRGWVWRTDRKARLREGQRRGRRLAVIWDVNPLALDVVPMKRPYIWRRQNWQSFFGGYRQLAEACKARQWRAQHAFTHMGLEACEP